MGRRKQGTKQGEIKTHSGLEPAWSSAPHRNPRYILYCTNHENERQYIVNSYALYAIRKIFDCLVGENEVEPSPLDPDRTMTFGDIDIKSEQMDEILAHVYTPEEEGWELPTPYPQEVEAFLTGGRMSKRLDNEPKPEHAPKAERAPAKSKIDRSKFITVQSLAEEIGIDPRDARAALRKAGTPKPEGGWLGDEAWAKDIRTVLANAKKALKGKK